MSPQVSVIIPVFNRAGTIQRAICSVLGQTRQDFEVLVVDDASTDDTVSAVAAIDDPRISLIRHPRRLGGGAARNSGIRMSRAPYVAFLDSDDEWMPTKLQRQLELFDRSRNQPGLVYSGFERRLSDGSVTRQIPRNCHDLSRKLLIDNVVGGTSVGVVRREVLERVGLFDERLRSGQDVDLWLRVCEQFPAAFVPDVLVRVWQHDTDRITANVAALISGREVFFEKHRDKMVRAGVAYLWLRNVGWIHHRFAGDLRAARSHYARSLRARPTAPLTHLMLLLACTPRSWLDRLARAKNHVAAMFGADPETWSPGGHVRAVSTVSTERPKQNQNSALS